MRDGLKAFAVAAGLAAAVAVRAEAQFVWQGCGGNLFNTCASVNISVTGTNELTMIVQNWGNYNPATNSFASFSGSSTFTQLGLLNGSFGGTMSGLNSFSCLNDSTCGWQFDGSMSLLGGFHSGGARCIGSGCNVNSGLNPPGTPGAATFTQVTLVFSTTGTINLTQTTFGLHGQSGPADLITGGTCSTKLSVTNNNGTYTPNQADATSSANCDVFNPVNPPTETPIPEPASMILLATGLVVMGGVGYLRRRNKKA